MMAALEYLRDDQDEVASATISVDTEDSLYVKGNLAAEPVAKPYRTTADTDESIEFDLGSAKSPDFMAVLNHNITSGATITWYVGASPTPTGNSQTFTYRADDMYVKRSSPPSGRYHRLRVQDSSNPDGYISIGRVLLGTVTALSKTFRPDWTREHDYPAARFGGSDSLSPNVGEILKRHILTFDFGVLTKTQLEEITGLLDATKGSVVPVFVMPDPDNYEGYYGRLNGRATERLGHRDYRAISLTLTEDGRGRAIGA